MTDTATQDVTIPVETAGKNEKHTNPIHLAMPEDVLAKMPKHVGKLVPSEYGWVNVRAFLVHRETGMMYLSKRALVLETMPRNQYQEWAYIRRTESGGYMASMLPLDGPYTITYDTPFPDTHIHVTHLLFRVKKTV